MGSEALHTACELSYVIARAGMESDPEVEPPRAMRSFLYVADLPQRALDVAKEAIEDDPAFRRRVAEQADEGEVGRAGYLWLHRPIGWAAEFEDLTAPEQDDLELGDDEDEVETVPAIADSDDAAEFLDDDGGETGRSLMGSGSDADGWYDDDSDSQNEANAFEDELTSLRGLVDRLASERKAVSSSAERVERQVESARLQPSVFDGDVYSLQSALDAAQNELEDSRRERDVAVQQHSNALTRQLELEMELERSRELRAEIERGHVEADSRMVELQETLAQAEATLTPMTEERDQLSQQIADVSAHNEQLVAQVEQLDELSNSTSRAAEARESELLAEAEALRADRISLESTLATSSEKLEETVAQLTLTASQSTETKALVEALTEEKIDLASRLADTEVMLETTRAQLSAVKADADALGADLSTVKTHRDGLSTQVDELHGSLSEALSNLAKVRSTSDADRSALKEVRTERDLLKVRLTSLEQVEAGLEAKLESMVSERDALAATSEQTRAEMTELERSLRELAEEKDERTAELGRVEVANTDLVGVRDELRAELDAVRAQLVETESSRDGLSQQVEQLTAENSAIQDQLVESDRLRVETSESQGHGLSELANRLSLVENERNGLEAEVAKAESRLGEALVALEKAQDVAERAARTNRGDSGGGRSTAASTKSAGKGTKNREPQPLVGDASDDGQVSSAEADAPSDHAEVDVDATRAEAETETADAVEAELDSGTIDIDDEDDKTELVDLKLDPPPPPPPPTGPALSDGDGDGDDELSDARGGKRHSWGLGPLLRGGARGRKADSDIDDTSTEDTDAAVDDAVDDDDEFAAIAAAVAEAAKTDSGEQDDVSEDDLDSISSELASAIDGVALDAEPDDEDDLDVIGDLISRTVTDFTPAKVGDAAAADGADADEVTIDKSASWTLLGGARNGQGNDDVTEPVSLPTARSNGGSPPPSVFRDLEDDDPFSNLDRLEAVTLSGETGEGRATPPSVLDDDGTRSETSRRQIAIPDELLDDEVELARHVVSSPDVVLLVDGDSVAKMGWPSLPVAQQRDALVSYLADLSASSGAAPDVVFDGRIGEEESLPASRAVRIRLSTPPTEPAAALDELVDAYPEQWPIAVVTDDEDLTSSATERGAVVLNNGQLLDLFIAQ